MRKVKIAFWLIVAALIGFVCWQNVWFFENQKFEIRFFDIYKYSTEVPIVLFFLVLFFAGLLIAYASGLSEKFIAKKTIRNLNSEVAAAKKRISELEGNIISLKAEAANREPEMPALPADAPESTVS
ncbi:MAG: LapA family protein [Desulfobacteraceae bacterium]|nr:LapA family protein [Desulfobacteraceae bacterium]